MHEWLFTLGIYEDAACPFTIFTTEARPCFRWGICYNSHYCWHHIMNVRIAITFTIAQTQIIYASCLLRPRSLNVKLEGSQKNLKFGQEKRCCERQKALVRPSRSRQAEITCSWDNGDPALNTLRWSNHIEVITSKFDRRNWEDVTTPSPNCKLSYNKVKLRSNCQRVMSPLTQAGKDFWHIVGSHRGPNQLNRWGGRGHIVRSIIPVSVIELQNSQYNQSASIRLDMQCKTEYKCKSGLPAWHHPSAFHIDLMKMVKHVIVNSLCRLAIYHLLWQLYTLSCKKWWVSGWHKSQKGL